jgi:hypothetical protein
MKKPKPHTTAQQFEDALLEQIKHARGQNVPINAISSAASFSILVLTRLFPGKTAGDALKAEFVQLRTDAIEERLEAQRQERKQEQEAKEAQARRIIIPGQGRN